ncbi:hypothetical protein GCM10022223_64400 [Kineosporia mesophila]|uniref:VCBS repeat-containing protein n=2 Tax=Kineosporia mesophila TaxID=566012 RepID=A0ABP7ANF5_9ACTN
MTFALAACLLVAGPAGSALAADVPVVGPVDTPAGIAAISTTACDPDGTKSADTTAANSLDGRLTGGLSGGITAYQASCARMIVKTVRDRGLSRQAGVIAVTTAIVESTLHNYTEETDHDSLGLFQQRASWGSVANRTNATWATTAFLNKMEDKYPNNSWQSAPVGEVCQAVQVSAYPDRYQAQAADAGRIVDAVWDAAQDRPAASFSGDAKTDLLVLKTNGELNARVNNGSYFADQGTYSSGWQAYLGHEGQGRLYFADWNGDGRKDMFVLKTNGELTVRTNNGTYFADQGTISSGWENYLGHEGMGRISFADWNGDGLDDMFVLKPTGDLDIRTNTGTHFSDQGIKSSGWENYLGHEGMGRISFADWNGDGLDDMFVLKPTGDLDIRTNTGEHFSDQGIKSSGWQSYLGDAGQGRLYFADWDGDGLDDMFVLKTSGELTVRTNTGTYFADQGTISSGWQAYLGHEGQGVLYLS